MLKAILVVLFLTSQCMAWSFFGGSKLDTIRANVKVTAPVGEFTNTTATVKTSADTVRATTKVAAPLGVFDSLVFTTSATVPCTLASYLGTSFSGEQDTVGTLSYKKIGPATFFKISGIRTIINKDVGYDDCRAKIKNFPAGLLPAANTAQDIAVTGTTGVRSAVAFYVVGGSYDKGAHIRIYMAGSAAGIAITDDINFLMLE